MQQQPQVRYLLKMWQASKGREANVAGMLTALENVGSSTTAVRQEIERVSKYSGIQWNSFDKLDFYFIGTEGALRLPTTYDNHPIQPIQPIPTYSYGDYLSIEYQI